MKAFSLEDVRKEYVDIRSQLLAYAEQYNKIRAKMAEGHHVRVRSVEFSFKDRTVEVFMPSKYVPLLGDAFLEAIEKTIDGLQQSLDKIREEWGKEINFEEDGKEQV